MVQATDNAVLNGASHGDEKGSGNSDTGDVDGITSNILNFRSRNIGSLSKGPSKYRMQKTF